MKYLLLLFFVISSPLNAEVYDLCDPSFNDDSPIADISFVLTHDNNQRLQSMGTLVKDKCEGKGGKFVIEMIETEKISTLCIDKKNLSDSEIMYFYFNYDGKMLYSRSLSNCSKQVSYFAQANALRAYLLQSK